MAFQFYSESLLYSVDEDNERLAVSHFSHVEGSLGFKVHKFYIGEIYISTLFSTFFPHTSRCTAFQSYPQMSILVLHCLLKQSSKLLPLLLAATRVQIRRQHQNSGLWDGSFHQICNMLRFEAHVLQSSRLISKVD